jgi:Zn-finger nucleic acid-binding protein
MIFLGSRHCQHCGAKAVLAEMDDNASARLCPRCRVQMGQLRLGATRISECPECYGLWVDAASFEQICADRERQAALLGAASPAASQTVTSAQGVVRYVPCPECNQLMNRVNFARCSGVVVDVCKGHGIWFDADELRQIVEFIRRGGLDAARAKEKEQLAEERRRLEQEHLAASAREHSLSGLLDQDERGNALLAAKGLLGLLRSI